jgi:hypothetical protein
VVVSTLDGSDSPRLSVRVQAVVAARSMWSLLVRAMTVPDAAIEAGARALRDLPGDEHIEDDVRAVLEAALPILRAEWERAR